MRKHFTIVLILAALGAGCLTPAFASTKAGTKCAKAGVTSIASGKKYTCVKSGKKLVWDKGVLVPVAKPAAFVANLSFDNLIENNSNISYTAWKKSSTTIGNNQSKAGTLNVYTGPKTKVFFEDISHAVNLVSRMFPSKTELKEIIWIRYSFVDIAWAEEKAKEKILPGEYYQLSHFQGGSLADGNCDTDTQNCMGAYEQTSPSGIVVVMEGVENSLPHDATSGPRLQTGMLQAHEYFHSIQVFPIQNKGINVWPHAWWREGGAEWVQNAAVNFNNYESYKKYLKDDCAYSCSGLSEGDISEFLTQANDNYLPPKFDSWLNYSLGSHVVEILVAIGGPNVIVDMYAEMGKGTSFSDAFKGFFGIAWKDAIPLLAKSVYIDLHS
jgi:hypothetical protein